MWAVDKVTVTVTGGTGPLDFGLVDDTKKPWEAEDCLGTTTFGFGPFCHEVEMNAVTEIPCVDTIDLVTDDTTLFCLFVESFGSDDLLTYYFGMADDSWCVVAGSDPDHYKAIGLRALVIASGATGSPSPRRAAAS